MIGLFPGTVHLKLSLFISVLQLHSGDKVFFLMLSLRQVVDSSWLMLSPLLFLMTQSQENHAQKHCQQH